MKWILGLMLMVGLTTKALATVQVAEVLIYKGQTNRLCTLPLEPYLKQHQVRLYELAPSTNILGSTACWRGYIGTWQIKDGSLWLVGVVNLDRTQVPLSKVFTNQTPPIKAAWYSGTLRVTQGKIVDYAPGFFGSVREREVYIEIEDGQVISEKVWEDQPSKNSNAE